MEYEKRINKSSPTPFTARLNELVGKEVYVTLEDGSTYRGKLLGYDGHLNVLLFVDGSRAVFRGSFITMISEGNKPVPEGCQKNE